MNKGIAAEGSFTWINSAELLDITSQSLLSAQAAFTACITGDKGQSEILTCLAEMTGASVLLEELERSQPDEPARASNSAIMPYLSAHTSLMIKNTKLLRDYPCRICAVTDTYPELTIYRLVTAVPCDHGRFALLSLVQSAEFSSETVAVLRIATDFFAIQTMLDKKVARIELKLRGNFVEDLLSRSSLDHESITSRARALDYDVTKAHRVLVGELDEGSRGSARFKREESCLRAELAKLAQSRLERSIGGLAVFLYNELIILVRQAPADDGVEAAKRIAEEITEEIARVLGLTIFIGIGGVCRLLEDYKDSYQAAKKALEIGRYMITEGQVCSFEQFKAHALFLSTIKPGELVKYAKGQLGALLEFDAEHGTELIVTLQEFLYLRNNIEGTAKSINMSVSGLKYRLKKIEHIICKELRDNKTSFDLQLALIILQLFGEYRIKNA